MVPIESALPVSGSYEGTDEVLARAGGENFPVASRLLPADVRTRLLAVYGFARLVDDVGDEAEGDRLALLDWLQADLERAAAGGAQHAVLQRLAPMLASGEISLEPLRSLIEANRMDQVVHRYATFDDLVAYCMLSAAPVGRLVLEVFGTPCPEVSGLSDDVCIGLQIVEHLQDVGEDARRGRVYLPVADLECFGCAEEDLLGSTASAPLRHVVAMEADRADSLLGSVVPLGHELPWRPRVAVCGFAGGGRAAIDAIRRADHDVLSAHCRPARSRRVVRALSYLISASGPERR
ncbi:MAG: squalene synthase HpnC [Acidimicrobiales bacterium]